MAYYTYIIYSLKTNKFYKGQTNNLKNRINRHNCGLENATKHGVPWQLLWFTMKLRRSEAVNLESKLKNLSRKRLVEFMLKYENDIHNNQTMFIKNLSSES